MPAIEYKPRKFRANSLDKIYHAQDICDSYAARGYTLTLRQLYYQFVSHDLIPNSQKEYDNLGALMTDARLAGYIDWDHLEDRTRNLQTLAHWATPADRLDDAARNFRLDLWEDQPHYVEAWVEKDALIGVLEGVCTRNDVPYFSCRGYTSVSEVWQASQRLITKGRDNEREVHIIHLGDHDPSGIDMTRDISDRLYDFCNYHGANEPTIHRVALNMDQVRTYNPPPNPAKTTDARYAGYIKRYGADSWELDALTPEVIEAVIQEQIDALINVPLWNATVERIEEGRQQIRAAAAAFRQENAPE